MEYKWYEELTDSDDNTIPMQLAKEIAKQNSPRLRLCPPYREHLSQSFARFFMRVGLPINIQIYSND